MQQITKRGVPMYRVLVLLMFSNISMAMGTVVKKRELKQSFNCSGSMEYMVCESATEYLIQRCTVKGDSDVKAVNCTQERRTK